MKNSWSCSTRRVSALAFMLLALLFAACSDDDDNPAGPADKNTGTVTDIDGNVYQTVKIGNQWWMAENLRVTHYQNGDPIPNVTDDNAWVAQATGAYCNYSNDPALATIYGRLYNWYAVSYMRSIAPAGWHVPTKTEWQQLADFLGGDSLAGGKMKEEGTAHWKTPNTSATNESGFAARAAGSRHESTGKFGFRFLSNDYWTATEFSGTSAWYRALSNTTASLGAHANNKHYGFSVRCVKD